MEWYHFLTYFTYSPNEVTPPATTVSTQALAKTLGLRFPKKDSFGGVGWSLKNGRVIS